MATEIRSGNRVFEVALREVARGVGCVDAAKPFHNYTFVQVLTIIS